MSLFRQDPITDLLEKLYLPEWEAVELTFPAHWGFRIPELTVSMYVFTQGSGWFQSDAPGSLPIRVMSGDHLITTRGRSHRMLHNLDGDAEPIADRLNDPTWYVPAGSEATSMVYAQFRLDDLHQNPLAIGVPEVIHLNHRRDAELKSCAPILDLLSSTKREAGSGWQTTVRKLAEIVFIKTLAAELNRGAGSSSSSDAYCLASAVTDALVGPVLSAIVSEPEKPWTVPQMARMADISKSAFSERFRNLVGYPPLQYLTEIRMQKACRLLRESNVEISNIATLVGYESPSSFSNAFRRWSNQSPVEYRRSE